MMANAVNAGFKDLIIVVIIVVINAMVYDQIAFSPGYSTSIEILLQRFD